MVSWLLATPGRLYIVATMWPLAVFALLLVGGGLRAIARPYRESNGLARFVYFFLGGHKPLRSGALLATGAIALSAVLGVYGLVKFLDEAKSQSPIELENRWAENTSWAHVGAGTSGPALSLELG